MKSEYEVMRDSADNPQIIKGKKFISFYIYIIFALLLLVALIGYIFGVVSFESKQFSSKAIFYFTIAVYPFLVYYIFAVNRSPGITFRNRDITFQVFKEGILNKRLIKKVIALNDVEKVIIEKIKFFDTINYQNTPIGRFIEEAKNNVTIINHIPVPVWTFCKDNIIIFLQIKGGNDFWYPPNYFKNEDLDKIEQYMKERGISVERSGI